MRIVTGYLDGHTLYRDDGPARARVAGYGGSLVTHTVTSVPPKRRLPRQPLNRVRILCGFTMRHGSPCMRGLHKDPHHRAALTETVA